MTIAIRKKRSVFIRKMLYTLKRSDGFPITLHKITSETHNYETGKKTPTIVTQKINRAIMLPGHMQRQFESDSLPTNFKYGALYDTSTKKVVIDAADLGDFEIEIEDYFIWDEKRWQVAQVDRLEYDVGYTIFARMVEGTPRHMVEEVSIETNLLLTSTVVEQLL